MDAQLLMDRLKNAARCVVSDHQLRHSAQAWQHIECTYPQTRSWTLEMPSWSIRNHHCYETNCGFSKIGEKETSDNEDSSFVSRKVIVSD